MIIIIVISIICIVILMILVLICCVLALRGGDLALAAGLLMRVVFVCHAIS